MGTSVGKVNVNIDSNAIASKITAALAGLSEGALSKLAQNASQSAEQNVQYNIEQHIDVHTEASSASNGEMAQLAVVTQNLGNALEGLRSVISERGGDIGRSVQYNNLRKLFEDLQSGQEQNIQNARAGYRRANFLRNQFDDPDGYIKWLSGTRDQLNGEREKKGYGQSRSLNQMIAEAIEKAEHLSLTEQVDAAVAMRGKLAKYYNETAQLKNKNTERKQTDKQAVTKDDVKKAANTIAKENEPSKSDVAQHGGVEPKEAKKENRERNGKDGREFREAVEDLSDIAKGAQRSGTGGGSSGGKPPTPKSNEPTEPPKGPGSGGVRFFDNVKQLQDYLKDLHLDDSVGKDIDTSLGKLNAGAKNIAAVFDKDGFLSGVSLNAMSNQFGNLRMAQLRYPIGHQLINPEDPEQGFNYVMGSANIRTLADTAKLAKLQTQLDKDIKDAELKANAAYNNPIVQSGAKNEYRDQLLKALGVDGSIGTLTNGAIQLNKAMNTTQLQEFTESLAQVQAGIKSANQMMTKRMPGSSIEGMERYAQQDLSRRDMLVGRLRKMGIDASDVNATINGGQTRVSDLFGAIDNAYQRYSDPNSSIQERIKGYNDLTKAVADADQAIRKEQTNYALEGSEQARQSKVWDAIDKANKALNANNADKQKAQWDAVANSVGALENAQGPNAINAALRDAKRATKELTDATREYNKEQEASQKRSEDMASKNADMQKWRKELKAVGQAQPESMKAVAEAMRGFNREQKEETKKAYAEAVADGWKQAQEDVNATIKAGRVNKQQEAKYGDLQKQATAMLAAPGVAGTDAAKALQGVMAGWQFAHGATQRDQQLDVIADAMRPVQKILDNFEKQTEAIINGKKGYKGLSEETRKEVETASQAYQSDKSVDNANKLADAVKRANDEMREYNKTMADNKANDAFANQTKQLDNYLVKLKELSTKNGGIDNWSEAQQGMFGRLLGNYLNMGGMAGQTQMNPAWLQSLMPSLPTAALNEMNAVFGHDQFKTYSGAVKGLNKDIQQMNGSLRMTAGVTAPAAKQMDAFTSYLLRMTAPMMMFRKLSGYMKQAANNVKAIDTQMADLKKVTSNTDAEYAHFLANTTKTAINIATPISDLVAATSTFAHMGYSLGESSALGTTATKFASVGNFQNTTAASESLIAIINGFNDLDIGDAELIGDKMTAIANNYAVTASDISEGLQKSASALNIAGNNVDQSAAMITAITETTRDAGAAGSALKVLSMRIRGAKSELSSSGESVDDMAESTSKLRAQVYALTNVSGKGGVDIMADATTFRSTYDILKDISGVWKEMNDIDQAALLELLAGKVRSNQAAALLNNFDRAEGALKTAQESAGTMDRVHARWMDSIEARQKQFQAAQQSLSQTVVDANVMKTGYQMGTGLLQAVQTIIGGTGNGLFGAGTGTLGALGSVLSTVGLFRAGNGDILSGISKMFAAPKVNTDWVNAYNTAFEDVSSDAFHNQRLAAQAASQATGVATDKLNDYTKSLWQNAKGTIDVTKATSGFSKIVSGAGQILKNVGVGLATSAITGLVAAGVNYGLQELDRQVIHKGEYLEAQAGEAQTTYNELKASGQTIQVQIEAKEAELEQVKTSGVSQGDMEQQIAQLQNELRVLRADKALNDIKVAAAADAAKSALSASLQENYSLPSSLLGFGIQRPMQGQRTSKTEVSLFKRGGYADTMSQFGDMVSLQSSQGGRDVKEFFDYASKLFESADAVKFAKQDIAGATDAYQMMQAAFDTIIDISDKARDAGKTGIADEYMMLTEGMQTGIANARSVLSSVYSDFMGSAVDEISYDIQRNQGKLNVGELVSAKNIPTALNLAKVLGLDDNGDLAYNWLDSVLQSVGQKEELDKLMQDWREKGLENTGAAEAVSGYLNGITDILDVFGLSTETMQQHLASQIRDVKETAHEAQQIVSWENNRDRVKALEESQAKAAAVWKNTGYTGNISEDDYQAIADLENGAYLSAMEYSHGGMFFNRNEFDRIVQERYNKEFTQLRADAQVKQKEYAEAAKKLTEQLGKKAGGDTTITDQMISDDMQVVSDLAAQVEGYRRLGIQLQEGNSYYAKWMAAQQNQVESWDEFNHMISAYGQFTTGLDKKTIGTNEFAAARQFLFGETNLSDIGQKDREIARRYLNPETGTTQYDVARRMAQDLVEAGVLNADTSLKDGQTYESIAKAFNEQFSTHFTSDFIEGMFGYMNAFLEEENKYWFKNSDIESDQQGEYLTNMAKYQDAMAKYQEAVANKEAVDKDENATQAMIDAATRAVDTAFSNLDTAAQALNESAAALDNSADSLQDTGDKQTDVDTQSTRQWTFSQWGKKEINTDQGQSLSMTTEAVQTLGKSNDNLAKSISIAEEQIDAITSADEPVPSSIEKLSGNDFGKARADDIEEITGELYNTAKAQAQRANQIAERLGTQEQVSEQIAQATENLDTAVATAKTTGDTRDLADILASFDQILRGQEKLLVPENQKRAQEVAQKAREMNMPGWADWYDSMLQNMFSTSGQTLDNWTAKIDEMEAKVAEQEAIAQQNAETKARLDAEWASKQQEALTVLDKFGTDETRKTYQGVVDSWLAVQESLESGSPEEVAQTLATFGDALEIMTATLTQRQQELEQNAQDTVALAAEQLRQQSEDLKAQADKSEDVIQSSAGVDNGTAEAVGRLKKMVFDAVKDATELSEAIVDNTTAPESTGASEAGNAAAAELRDTTMAVAENAAQTMQTIADAYAALGKAESTEEQQAVLQEATAKLGKLAAESARLRQQQQEQEAARQREEEEAEARRQAEEEARNNLKSAGAPLEELPQAAQPVATAKSTEELLSLQEDYYRRLEDLAYDSLRRDEVRQESEDKGATLDRLFDTLQTAVETGTYMPDVVQGIMDYLRAEDQKMAEKGITNEPTVESAVQGSQWTFTPAAPTETEAPSVEPIVVPTEVEEPVVPTPEVPTIGIPTNVTVDVGPARSAISSLGGSSVTVTVDADTSSAEQAIENLSGGGNGGGTFMYAKEAATGTDYAADSNYLVDEQGQELIEHVKRGTYELGTNNGARFTKLDKGDIVHTAKETKKILNRKVVTGFAFANGYNQAGGAGFSGATAADTAKWAADAAAKAQAEAQKAATASASLLGKGLEALAAAAEKVLKMLKGVMDYIPQRLKVLKRTTNDFIRSAELTISYVGKNSELSKAIDNIAEEIEANKAAMAEYKDFLHTLAEESHLPDDLIEQLEQGAIDIEIYRSQSAQQMATSASAVSKNQAAAIAINGSGYGKEKIATIAGFQSTTSAGTTETMSKQQLTQMELKALKSDATPENMVKVLTTYQQWYEKMVACQESLATLEDQMRTLNKQKLDNIVNYYKNIDSLLQDQIQHQETLVDLKNAYGWEVKETDYSEALRMTADVIDNVHGEITALSNEMAEQLGVGSATMEAVIDGGKAVWETIATHVKNGVEAPEAALQELADMLGIDIASGSAEAQEAINDLKALLNTTWDNPLAVGSDTWYAYTSTLEQLKTTAASTKIQFRELSDTVAKLPVNNLKTGYSYLERINKDVEQLISLREAQGGSAQANAYRTLISNGNKEIENLEMQNLLIRQQMDGLDILSDKYQELQEELDGNRETIMDIRIDQEKWNDAIIDLEISQLQKQNDKYKEQLSLMQALDDMEKARQHRVLMYSDDAGFTYVEDEDAFEDASQSVHEALFQHTISRLEEQKENENIYGPMGERLVSSQGITDYAGNKLVAVEDMLSGISFDNYFASILSGVEQSGLLTSMLNTINMADVLGATMGGDINIDLSGMTLEGINDAQELGDAIIKQLPGYLVQYLYSKGN